MARRYGHDAAGAQRCDACPGFAVDTNVNLSSFCFVAIHWLCQRGHLLPRRRVPVLRVHCFIISRTKIRSTAKLPAGPTTIVVETRYAEQRPAGPLDITIQVGREVLAKGRVPFSAPLLFTANDCFDIGVCLGSPVSLDYYGKAPFAFDGQIERVHVAYT